MDVRGLVVALWLWVYASIGAWIEERKLHVQFADAYRRYCATTPQLVPRLPRRRRAVAPLTQRKESR
jgi:protein-S-isoprenylcysteine O-methyltransferase Ste14